jgi:hypothetical protein
MRKNLLKKEGNESVIGRVQNLRPDSSALWGKMTVTEMLHHCNKVHAQLLMPAEPTSKKTSLKQYLIRWLVLYVMPRFPKGAQAPKKFHTKGMIDSAEFEKQKQELIASVHLFTVHAGPINHWHPYFGKLSTAQWGLTSWKHIDHHLRQFGV